MKILIIIPAYNEEKNLPLLLKRLKHICPACDIIVVNDCSKDGTSLVCESNSAAVINLPVNLGIGGAVQAGYKYAYYNNYDIAIQIDGDGQHNPQYVNSLVKEIENGANLCIGSRFIDKTGFQSTLSRRVGIIYFSRLIKILTGQTITDPTSGFRACDRKVLELFTREYPVDYPEPETIITITKKNLKISEIPVVMNSREKGESSITSLKSVYYMIKVSLAIIIDSFRSNENLKEVEL